MRNIYIYSENKDTHLLDMWSGCWMEGMQLERIQAAAPLLTYFIHKRRHNLKTKKPKFEGQSNIDRFDDDDSDFCKHLEFFKKVVEMGVPCNELCVEEKLCWLRSQIIGNDLEFDSPFGRRLLVYADHTASGRSLHYSENFITNHLLPFYGIYIYFMPQHIHLYTLCI